MRRALRLWQGPRRVAASAEVYQRPHMILADVTSVAQLLLSIFVSDLLPVFAIAGVGFVLARFAGVQVQTVSRLTFHALAPALVFNILATSTADSGQVGRMTLFYALVALSAATMARLRGHSASTRPPLHSRHSCSS